MLPQRRTAQKSVTKVGTDWFRPQLPSGSCAPASTSQFVDPKKEKWFARGNRTRGRDWTWTWQLNCLVVLGGACALGVTIAVGSLPVQSEQTCLHTENNARSVHQMRALPFRWTWPPSFFR